jgi:DNA-binding SARP family transcriptional activator/tetratricopeptide (TPR) repeat protein
LLAIKLLGELEVSRDGTTLALPPSRKTRALLAYLAATGRQHRRDRLCSLLWDVPDDPRGALRWSLSRIRGLVDEADNRRLISDRDWVGFESKDADIDLLRLRRNVRGLESMPLDALERLAGLFRGEFLECIDLPDLHDFQAWCVAEREDVRRLQVRILEAIARQTAHAPEAALPHAKKLVHIDPFNVAARVNLLTQLMAADRRTEAEQQFEAGIRQMRETGEEQTLAAAWRGLQPRREPIAQPLPVAPVAMPFVASRAPADSPFLGRESDLALLSRAMSATLSNGGVHVVLVVGEPGLGKTRLIEAAASNAQERGFRIVKTRSHEVDRTRPYAAWREVIGAIAPPAAAPGADNSASEAAHRERFLMEASERILAAPEAPGPTLIVLDDVQWCDTASLDLLHALSSGPHALLVILGARSGELADNPAALQLLRGLRHDRMLEEMQLEPLGAEALAALVGSVAPEADPRRIAVESGGNPFFAIELARHALHDDTGLPRPLKHLIRDRVERLPAHASDVLRWASVIGTTFSADRLPVLAGIAIEALTTALEVLERNDFIRASEDGGDYVFVHELINRAVYTTLSEPRRRLMHLRIAETLRDQAGGIERFADEIVHHAVLAGDNGMAAAACVEAGRHSLRLFANVEAAGLARRGLRHAETLREPERLMRRIELTRIAFLADRPRDVAEASRTLEALAEAALDHDCANHARVAYETLSLLRWERGFWVEAARDTVRAEMASRNEDDGTRALTMAETARCLVMLERDLHAADALLMEASAMSRRLNLEPATIPDATGLLRMRRGEFDAAVSDFQRARFLARRDGDRITEFLAMEHLAELELARRGYAEAASLAIDMANLARRLGPGSEGPFASALAALCRMAIAGPAASIDLDTALDALRHADAKHRLSFMLSAAAAIDLDQERPGAARVRAEESLLLATAINSPSHIALAEAAVSAAIRAPERRMEAVIAAAA